MSVNLGGGFLTHTVQQLCLLYAADDVNGSSSLSAVQDISCLRILPTINDVLSREEPNDHLPDDSSCSALCDASGVCSGGGHPACQKLNCHTDVYDAADGPPGDKLLPSVCAANWASVDHVAVADVHAADSSPREKLLPSLRGASPTNDSCDSLADVLVGVADMSVADGQPQEKLLPSLTATI